MKKYEYIAFDLDGTLTDPQAGLIEGFVYALKKIGIPYQSRGSLKKYIGPPLFETWKRDFNLSDREAENLVLTFREYYNIYGWWDNKIYSGIKELLEGLKAMGKTLIVATSKPEDTAKKVLNLFGIDKYFDFIGGADGHKNRDKKAEVLEYSLKNVGVDLDSKKKGSCILIGDRHFDADGAKLYGIDSMGILWGHGSEEEIRTAGFTYIAKAPQDVLDILK